ncbi:hypothetical protein [Desulfomicrobium escambiense]|uniref:hypothetical protein n=1 Tax=Desulfomicrobium escambiense TaxID=29503 RepID=UPI000490E750|nr:hypothetical protein [Desulfomicrobium escambiense]
MQHTTTSQPPLPVTLYPVGRFLFPVPQGLEFQGRIININDMSIEETDWNSGDRAKQFRALWEPVRDEARKHYDVYKNTPVVRGGFVQEDVSEHFGHPAVLLCYSAQNGAHWIDTFVALPDWILRIKEETAYEIGKECLGDLKGTTLDFYRHYHTDRSALPADLFWTGRGWVQGLKTRDESVDAFALRTKTETTPEISLSLMAFTIFRPDEPTKSIAAIRKIFKAHGAELKILRSRQLFFAGRPGLEEAFVLSPKESGEHATEFSGKWTIEGEPRNPERPRIVIRMECKTDDHREALRIWDAVLENFTSIQEWHAKMRGGR